MYVGKAITKVALEKMDVLKSSNSKNSSPQFKSLEKCP